MIARLAGLLWSSVLRLLAATWTMTLAGFDSSEEVLARNRVVAGFWHGQTVPLYWCFRDRGALIFTSESFRGSVIREVCKRFGLAAESLPDHAGDVALARMRQSVDGYRLIGIALDGPLGPSHAVKRGTIQLASQVGLLFVPLGLASSSAFVARRRWDRMEIPLPFSRVAVVAGAPITIPPGVEASDVAPWAARILASMEEAENRARLAVRR